MRLLRDRDRAFGEESRRRVKALDIQEIPTAPQSPWQGACAQRFVRSIKSECLAQVIPLGERHLRRAVREYVAHYHGERNHQGIDNRLIDSVDGSRRNGRIECRERLGGLLRFYRRAAWSSTEFWHITGTVTLPLRDNPTVCHYR